MNRYRVTAKLLSPLALKRDRQSERSEGLETLSGTVLRGALAGAWLRSRGQPDDNFMALFCDETRCRFGPLAPAVATLPLSAVSCKRKAGFIRDEGHGVADVLWARAVRRLVGPRLSNDWFPRQCKFLQPDAKTACANDLKAFAGYYHPEDPARGTKNLRRSVATHVGIDRQVLTAADGILYSLEAIDPLQHDPVKDDSFQPTQLSGELWADDGAKVALDRLLSEEDEIYAGHHRTRGYGRLTLELSDAVPGPGPDTWQAWSDALLTELVCADVSFAPDEHFAFGLSLPTGAILLDTVLRYSNDPAAMVSWLAPLPSPRLDPVGPGNEPGKEAFGGRLWCLHGVTRLERLRGWNAAHGLPRQDEWAVVPGAAYVYLFRGDSAARAGLVRALVDLEKDGIGARRNEGLGRILVSDDFHRRFHRQEVTQ